MEQMWPWPDNYRIATTDMDMRSSTVTQGRLIQLECRVHHQELSHDPIRPLLQTGVVQKDCGRPRPISAVTTTTSLQPRPAFDQESVAVQEVSSLVRHRADIVDVHQQDSTPANRDRTSRYHRRIKSPRPYSVA